MKNLVRQAFHPLITQGLALLFSLQNMITQFFCQDLFGEDMIPNKRHSVAELQNDA